MKKILITGGAGFIGSHVSDNLLEKGKEVMIFDRRRRKRFRKNCTMFFGDVKNRESLFDAVYHSDGVIHLASLLGTQESIKTACNSVEVNVCGSLNVFDACKLYGKRAVYIAVGNHWMNNPYSITKTTAERFAFMYNKEFGTEIAVVRGLNAYGPRQEAMPVRKVMPNFILPALKNEKIIIYGTGNQIMDMIYVTDIAEILVRALLMNHENYESVMEAGLGKDKTINDIAHLVIEISESKSKIEHIKMRPGEIPDSIVKGNVETLKCLDYPIEQMTSLRKGIEKTIRWYRHHLED